MRNSNSTKRCRQCGCIYLADATRCPKCGFIQKYNSEKISNNSNATVLSSAPEAHHSSNDIMQTVANIAYSNQFELISATIVFRSR